MNSNLVHNKLKEYFAKDKIISVRRLRNLTLANKDIPFKIWGKTIDGDEYEGREVFTFNGPSRDPGVPYNYNAKGYMIMFDMRKGAYRTFIYDNITQLELNGITYKIQ